MLCVKHSDLGKPHEKENVFQCPLSIVWLSDYRKCHDAFEQRYVPNHHQWKLIKTVRGALRKKATYIWLRRTGSADDSRWMRATSAGHVPQPRPKICQDWSTLLVIMWQVAEKLPVKAEFHNFANADDSCSIIRRKAAACAFLRGHLKSCPKQQGNLAHTEAYVAKLKLAWEKIRWHANSRRRLLRKMVWRKAHDHQGASLQQFCLTSAR